MKRTSVLLGLAFASSAAFARWFQCGAFKPDHGRARQERGGALR